MTWFKVDDGFYSHAKVLSIPRSLRTEALGTWVLCGTWAADKLTDGHVPIHMVEELGGTIAGAEALTEVRLWRRIRTEFVFVNWDEWQYTREEVEGNRKRERERKAEARRKAHDSGGVSGNVPVGQTADTARTNPVSGLPVPSRPVQGLSTQVDDVRPVPRTGDEPVDNSDGLEARARLFRFDPVRVRQVLARTMREIPEDDSVMAVGVGILGRAKSVPRDATAYIIGAIRQNPQEAEQLAYGGAA